MNPVNRSAGPKNRINSFLKEGGAQLALLVLGLFSSLTTWGQQSAVVSTSSGNRVYLEVSSAGLRSDLDTLYARIANVGQLAGAASTLTWSDVLTNGGNPGGDVDFNGYDAGGLANVTGSGTMTIDSISVAKVINGQVNSLGNHDTDGLSEGSTKWSSSPFSSSAWLRELHSNYDDVNPSVSNRRSGFSVRCVRD